MGAIYDMKRPCRRCPFGTGSESIRFATAERAIEIAQSATIHGFPCHSTADRVEYSDDEALSGFVFGSETQACAGFLIMKLSEDAVMPWPGIGDDDAVLEKIKSTVDLTAPVFRDLGAFIRANGRRGK